MKNKIKFEVLNFENGDVIQVEFEDALFSQNKGDFSVFILHACISHYIRRKTSGEDINVTQKVSSLLRGFKCFLGSESHITITTNDAKEAIEFDHRGGCYYFKVNRVNRRESLWQIIKSLFIKDDETINKQPMAEKIK